MKASVIFSTYNSVEWLKKTLWGFSVQSLKDFEVVIADDGSKEETRKVIENISKEIEIPIQHVWQADDGFQKSKILNKAIVASKSDYLIFTDGDCIPRKDFVEKHLENRKAGYFLSGGYFKLPMKTSQIISKEDIISQRCFDKDWLIENGLKKTYKTLKLTSAGKQSNFLNAITPTKATWNGHNSSGWKKDIIAINGFDERMQYGGQDRELGERLVNLGIKSVQIRYSAVCLHLDHKRGYKTEESIKKNQTIRKNTRKSGTKWTDFGIEKK